MIISYTNIGAAVLLCTLTVNLSEFYIIVRNFLSLVRPRVELEIVLDQPNLELVPGIRAMDLSAPAHMAVVGHLFAKVIAKYLTLLKLWSSNSHTVHSRG